MAKSGNGLLLGALAIGGIALLAFSGTAKAATTPAVGPKPNPKPNPTPGPTPGPAPAPSPAPGSPPPTIAGCQVDPNFPSSYYPALQDMLTNPNLDVVSLTNTAQAYQNLGYPKAAQCLFARSVVQQQKQGYPGGSAPVIQGCQVDANFPAEYTPSLGDMLSNPNVDSTSINALADSYNNMGYPMAAACLKARAATQAANGL